MVNYELGVSDESTDYLGNISGWKHFPLPAFGITDFPEENGFPQNVSGNYLNFFSLKTGLVQREVASQEESSIWTNRLSVKQDFFYKEKGIYMKRTSKMGQMGRLFQEKKCSLRKTGGLIKKNVY